MLRESKIIALKTVIGIKLEAALLDKFSIETKL